MRFHHKDTTGYRSHVWSRLRVGTAMAAALAMTVVLATGCTPFTISTEEQTSVANTDTLEGAESTKNYISVGFSQLGSESQWRRANTKSIEETLTEENGFFLLSDNARQMQDNQIKEIRSYISQRVNYIVFAPVTEDGWNTVLGEAHDAGIPVIAVDRTVSLSARPLLTTFIGEDMRKEGESAGHWLEDYLEAQGRSNENINLVVLQGTIGSSAQKGRSIGFDSIADKHANWNILEQRDAEFTKAKGEEVMDTFLRKYKDIDVVVSQNDDMTFGAIQAMRARGVNVGEDGMIIISFDATREALELVQDGIINVDVECNPLTGPLLKSVIETIEAGNTPSDEYYMQEMVFTKENVGAYIENRTY